MVDPCHSFRTLPFRAVAIVPVLIFASFVRNTGPELINIFGAQLN